MQIITLKMLQLFAYSLCCGLSVLNQQAVQNTVAQTDYEEDHFLFPGERVALKKNSKGGKEFPECYRITDSS